MESWTNDDDHDEGLMAGQESALKEKWRPKREVIDGGKPEKFGWKKGRDPNDIAVRSKLPLNVRDEIKAVAGEELDAFTKAFFPNDGKEEYKM